jgi:hypothetical protein
MLFPCIPIDRRLKLCRELREDVEEVRWQGDRWGEGLLR